MGLETRVLRARRAGPGSGPRVPVRRTGGWRRRRRTGKAPSPSPRVGSGVRPASPPPWVACGGCPCRRPSTLTPSRCPRAVGRPRPGRSSAEPPAFRRGLQRWACKGWLPPPWKNCLPGSVSGSECCPGGSR